jgi:cytoskeletal protein CcmA (bactofilin family)
VAVGGAKVLGDVEVEEAELAGTVSIRGKLIAARVHVRGTLDVGGEVRVAERLSIEGSGRFDAAVRAGALELDGTFQCAAPLTVDRLARWKGTLDVVGALTADRAEFDGRIAATGDLIASTLVGRLRGASHVEQVRSHSIVLTRPGLLPPLQTGKFTVVRIDATEAKLEGVEAEFVKSETIDLGPGCHIAAVEGRVLRVHASSHVGPESRTPKPHGMTR